MLFGPDDPVPIDLDTNLHFNIVNYYSYLYA
jgi:hypothetical protein